MQDLYDAVRSTGAENVVLAGGLNFAYDLSQVLSFPVRGFNIAFATHPYNFGGKQPSDWDDDWGFLAATHPVVITEFGDTTSATCSAAYSEQVVDYAEARQTSWIAWAWFVDESCAFPPLISDWDGSPTAVGTVVQEALGE